MLALSSLIACGSEGAADGTDTGATGASTGAPPTGSTTNSPGSSSTSGDATTDPTSEPTTTPTSEATSGPTTGPDADTSTTVGATDESSSSSGEPPPLEPFSFFVTSLRAMQELSGSQDGFGGDLRFGERGPGAGLRGADKICATIAEQSMPGAAAKGWRAFLSANEGEDGQPVHAIDRVGPGPWFDRLGRVVAQSPADLAHERPTGADAAIADDLPNEEGVPNHQPDPNMDPVDNHDTLTGSDKQGRLDGQDSNCDSWTSSVGEPGTKPTIGHSWPRAQDNGRHWISDHEAGGCAPGTNVFGMGGPQPGDYTVGAGGGYGAIYCFALVP